MRTVVGLFALLFLGACAHLNVDNPRPLTPPHLYVEVPGNMPSPEAFAAKAEALEPLIAKAFATCKVHLIRGHEERYIACMKKFLNKKGFDVYTQDEYNALLREPETPIFPPTTIALQAPYWSLFSYLLLTYDALLIRI